MNPPELRYSKEHEWVRVQSNREASIGITEFAAESLGDVVFLDLPQVGEELSQFEKLGEVESVKAVSDIHSPVSGRVIERNDKAIENPQLVNDSPYESGWLLKLTLDDSSEMDRLMTAQEYETLLASQEQ